MKVKREVNDAEEYTHPSKRGKTNLLVFGWDGESPSEQGFECCIDHAEQTWHDTRNDDEQQGAYEVNPARKQKKKRLLPQPFPFLRKSSRPSIVPEVIEVPFRPKRTRDSRSDNTQTNRRGSLPFRKSVSIAQIPIDTVISLRERFQRNRCANSLAAIATKDTRSMASRDSLSCSGGSSARDHDEDLCAATEQQESILPFLVRLHNVQGMEERAENEPQARDDEYLSVECILPTLLVSEEILHFLPAECKTDRSGFLFRSYFPDLGNCEAASETLASDDPWTAAKRGDLWTLKQFALKQTPPVDWTAEDEFNGTPLYYACHSGAAAGEQGMESVRFLLQVWPEHPIPSDLLDRCRKNAINHDVLRLLNPAGNPETDLGEIVIRGDDRDIFDESDDEQGGMFSLFVDTEEAADY